MALNLFGVTFADAQLGAPAPAGAETVVVRELAAIVADCRYSAIEPDAAGAARTADVIAACAARGAVLPAPVGVVFRSRDAVLRWLELHYVALSDALGFVEDRVAGRVYVRRLDAAGERDASADVTAAAAEGLRVIRRAAVATVPLRTEQGDGLVQGAAFLVEQELWKEFGATVEEQGSRAPDLRFVLTGPWPPYDFVQMQFGG